MNDRAAHLLAKLAPKVQSMSVSDGGIPELTQTDIAAAQGGMGLLPYLICQVKYAGDTKVKPLLVKTVADRVVRMARRRNLLVKKDRAARLSGVALTHLISCGRHKTCGGTGMYNGSRCCGCQGTGIIEWSDFYVASNIGMDVRTYQNKYKKFYADLVHYLQSEESDGMDYIRNRCK